MTLLNGCLLKSVNTNETLDAAHYERVFLYCLAWGIGGLLDVKDRPAFDTELRTLSQAMPQKASFWELSCTYWSISNRNVCHRMHSVVVTCNAPQCCMSASFSNLFFSKHQQHCSKQVLVCRHKRTMVLQTSPCLE